MRKAGPAIMGRGVVQLSGYLDLVLASLLAIGAVARLRYAQTLYLLPISLFAHERRGRCACPISRATAMAPSARCASAPSAAVRRVAFFVVPSFVAFVAIGDVLVAGLYRAGEFGAADVRVVWLILIGYSFGLLASTTTRVYQSAFFALRDTATPARAAFVRVLVALVAGAVLMVQFEPVTVLGFTIPAGALAGFDADGLPLGPLGLAAGAAVGAWVEWALLKRALGARLGRVGAGVRTARAHVRGGACGRRRRLLHQPLAREPAAAARGVGRCGRCSAPSISPSRSPSASSRRARSLAGLSRRVRR